MGRDLEKVTLNDEQSKCVQHRLRFGCWMDRTTPKTLNPRFPKMQLHKSYHRLSDFPRLVNSTPTPCLLLSEINLKSHAEITLMTSSVVFPPCLKKKTLCNSFLGQSRGNLRLDKQRHACLRQQKKWKEEEKLNRQQCINYTKRILFTEIWRD